MQVDREWQKKGIVFCCCFFSKLLRSIAPSIKIEHSFFFIFFNEVSFDPTNGKKKSLTIMCMFSLEVKEGRDLFPKCNGKFPSKGFLI